MQPEFNVNVRLNPDNSDHMAALSDFAGALARDARSGNFIAGTTEQTDEAKLEDAVVKISAMVGKPASVVREVLEQAAAGEGGPGQKAIDALAILFGGKAAAPVQEIETETAENYKVKTDHAAMMEQSAEQIQAYAEKGEEAKAKSKRRSSAQVALDKQIKADDLPPRLKGETPEEYHDRTANEHGPGNVETDAAPTPSASETPTSAEPTTESTATDGGDTTTADNQAPTQEQIGGLVIELGKADRANKALMKTKLGTLPAAEGDGFATRVSDLAPVAYADFWAYLQSL